MKKVFLILAFIPMSFSTAQSTGEILAAFDSAAREFDVPTDVLKGIAFAETRWQQLTWPNGDTASSCTGMPRPYGIMSLWDNQYFGHSLTVAAALIGKDPAVLKENMVQNIRGAAALLKKLHDELPLPSGTSAADIESWRNAIASYSGLPRIDFAQQHALDIYAQMNLGYHKFHIDWNAHPVNLGPIRESVSQIESNERAKKLLKGTKVQSTENQPDYPLAKWVSAYPGHWYTSGSTRSFVVIHDMEGYYLATISYFQMASTQASIYYCINGQKDDSADAPAGDITQMVEEKYWAWHVRCWNPYMFGIEHEGFVDNPAWYTDAMYKASAKLTAYLCNKYNIPRDRDHIIGHDEWQNPAWTSWMATNFPGIDVTCNDHTDPGVYWNWNYYMDLLRPVDIVSAYPPNSATNIPGYKAVNIQFNIQMDSASVIGAFKLNPSIPGTFAWSNTFTNLQFKPDHPFAFATTYNLTIDSTAKEAQEGRYLDGNGSGQGASQFHLSFTTVPLDTAPPAITSYYPHSTTTDFPSTGEAVIRYNEPLLLASPQSSVQFKDSTGAPVSPFVVRVDTEQDVGSISIASTQLRPNSRYTVVFSSVISDLYGNSGPAGITLSFVTSPESTTEGIVFDSFESNARAWIQPNQNSGSVLIDAAATQFSFSSQELRSGSQSGKLAYKFAQSQGGISVLQAGVSPTLDSYSSFGIWVFGDESRNLLRITFLPQNQAARLDTIDWMGWKFLNVPLSNVVGPSKRFNSIDVLQTVAGATTGFLYFDDMQVNSLVSQVEKSTVSLPADFALAQNYPNPFNPATIIRYQVPKESRVKLIVYNLLGQVVRTLVDQSQGPGSYSRTFDASGLPSGIYFYRLETADFHDVEKMLLIR